MNLLESYLYLIIQGLAVGSLYGLIALGIVLIYKTSEILNFAHGNIGMIAAFFCYTLALNYIPIIIDGITGLFSGIGLFSWMGPTFFYTISFSVIILITFLISFIMGLTIEFFTLRHDKKPLAILIILLSLYGIIFLPGVAKWISLAVFIVFAFELFSFKISKDTELGLIVITIGLWLILDGAVIWIFGTQDKSMMETLPFTNFNVYKLGKIPISQLDLIILLVTVILIVALFLFFRFSKVGIAMRATSQNEDAARLMGIKTRRVHALTWGLSSVLGAIAGILAAFKFFLSNTTMFSPFLKAFAAATLGGLGSLPGAIVGGWILGVSENLFAFGFGIPMSIEIKKVLMSLKTPFAFLVIIVVLSIRPSGLLGKHYIKKV